MHWMGGMGVLILTIALLPSLGGRTLHVMRAESPGPIVSKLVPKTSQSSKILYGIYCALTLLEVFCLRIAGMPWYDSLVHSFATAGTGGFSTRNLSIAAYESPAIEVIITLFMLVFSINFSLYFLLLCGKVRQALRSDELRFFLAMVAFSTLLIS
ncbi:potassium transporter TrkG, partial [Clostridioides difficile]|nr:potassium transporter TrkG [Clostridioides difficile]